MNSSVLPIFRSDSQLAVLDTLLSTNEAMSTTEIIQSAGLSQPLAHRELRRLTDAGLLREKRIGRSAQFEADDTNPAVSHLRALITIALGPQKRLASVLHGIPGVERALIFGSFAARAAGVAGTSPGDIDLLIIGTPNRRDIYDAIDGIDEAVRREVNVTFLRPERWTAADDELVRRVKANPIMELVVA